MHPFVEMLSILESIKALSRNEETVLCFNLDIFKCHFCTQIVKSQVILRFKTNSSLQALFFSVSCSPEATTSHLLTDFFSTDVRLQMIEWYGYFLSTFSLF